MMKVLCVCMAGICRSVTLAGLLKTGEPPHDALAVGMGANSSETNEMLYDWADKIILLDKNLECGIAERHKHKLMIYDVGEDRFFSGYNTELVALLKEHLSNQPLVGIHDPPQP